ncbi:DUF2304 domain-containing protein [uncultured Ruthenibacterium sp.]|uniref:DUF2304 domain-containing protein n=1 Tax=uncultured Ruthenibacterium sp. TaxID=1905347 RepID=UPI00349E89FD
MNNAGLSLFLRIDLILGALVYLGVILWLLKKNKLTIRYSIIWLLSGLVLLVFAVFPYIVLVMRDLLHVEIASNLVFMIVLAFVLLLLLSLSSIVSGFSEKIKRLSQCNALLERRVRELEKKLEELSDNTTPSQ